MPSLSGATSYAYDAKDRLTQESSSRAGGFTNNYDYDNAGNPTMFKGQARTYNAKNQLTGGTGLAGAFAYDSDGNPTTYNGAALTFNVNGYMTSFGTAINPHRRCRGPGASRVIWRRGGGVRCRR